MKVAERSKKNHLKWTQNEEQTIMLAYVKCNNWCFMFELQKHKQNHYRVIESGW